MVAFWRQGLLGGLGRQPIANPRFTEQVSGMRGIGFDLLAKLPHQHPQVLGLVDGVRAPDGLQDRAMGQHAIRVAREKRQQIKFLRRQADLFVASDDTPPIVVPAESRAPALAEQAP